MLRMLSCYDCQHALDDTEHQMSPPENAKSMTWLGELTEKAGQAIFHKTS